MLDADDIPYIDHDYKRRFDFHYLGVNAVPCRISNPHPGIAPEVALRIPEIIFSKSHIDKYMQGLF